MVNRLAHLADFEEVMKTYKISQSLKKELLKDKLVLLTAPTSVGRNTIINKLVATGRYYFVLSDTTRNPRINDGVMEHNGVTYMFKTETEILAGLKRGEYLEAAIIHSQQVSGMRVAEIKKASEQNKIAIKDVDIQGIAAYSKVKPDTIALFVLPPSFEEWMRRLKHRGPMSNQEFKRRLDSAIVEFDYALKSEKLILVINDNLASVTKEIRDLAENPSKHPKNQVKCRELVLNLRQSAQELKKLFSTLD